MSVIYFLNYSHCVIIYANYIYYVYNAHDRKHFNILFYKKKNVFCNNYLIYYNLYFIVTAMQRAIIFFIEIIFFVAYFE